jgi:hypothetical protein
MFKGLEAISFWKSVGKASKVSKQYLFDLRKL